MKQQNENSAVTVIPHTNWYFTVSNLPSDFLGGENGNRHFFAKGVKERVGGDQEPSITLLLRLLIKQKIRF